MVYHLGKENQLKNIVQNSTVFFLIFLIFFQVMICYNDPASHPFITDSEKEYIQETLKCTSRETDLPPTPWRAIWTSVPLWALICAQVNNIHFSSEYTFFA